MPISNSSIELIPQAPESHLGNTVSDTILKQDQSGTLIDQMSLRKDTSAALEPVVPRPRPPHNPEPSPAHHWKSRPCSQRTGGLSSAAREAMIGLGRETTMDYVMLLRWKQGLTRDQRDGALMHRAGWNYPAGVKLIAEYWPAAEDPAVVSIFQADNYAALMEVAFTWGDTFDITVIPAISAEEGLKIGPDVMGRRQF